MTEIVINVCYGGFGLSDKAENLYAEKSGFKIYRYKWEGRGSEYVRLQDGETDFVPMTYKTDHGDRFEWWKCLVYYG